MPLWLPFYSKHHSALSLDVQQKLLNISASSIDRCLKPLRDKLEIKRRCHTRPGTLLSKQIPFKKDVAWNPQLPGLVEADTVAHCGGSLTGESAWSLTVTDIKTTWTENRAIWNKGSVAVLEQVKDIEKYLPFSLLGFNSDSGSEFLNNHLVRYLQQTKSPKLLFSRS